MIPAARSSAETVGYGRRAPSRKRRPCEISFRSPEEAAWRSAKFTGADSTVFDRLEFRFPSPGLAINVVDSHPRGLGRENWESHVGKETGKKPSHACRNRLDRMMQLRGRKLGRACRPAPQHARTTIGGASYCGARNQLLHVPQPQPQVNTYLRERGERRFQSCGKAPASPSRHATPRPHTCGNRMRNARQ